MELKIELVEKGKKETKFLPLDDEKINPTVEVFTGKVFDQYKLFEINDLGFEVVHHVGTLKECERLKTYLENSFDEEDE